MRTNEDPLIMYVVYDHPIDYPENVVVRRWLIYGGEPQQVDLRFLLLTDTIDNCRNLMAEMFPWLVCIRRDPLDDPKIVETWL